MAQFYGDWIYDEEYKHWRPGLSYGIRTETDTQATIWITAELDAGYYYLNSSVEGEDKTLLGRVIYKIGDQEQIVREVHIPFPFIEGVGNKVFDNFDLSVDKTTEEQNIVMSVIIQGIKYEDFYWDRDLNQPEKSTITRTITIPSLPTYTISYDTNEGIWRNEAPADQTKTHDISLTLTSIQPIRTGYNFIGWNTQPDGTGISYEVSGNYTENANATLYAQWEIRTYTISYDANEGAWENDEAPADQIKIYDQPLALTSIHPIRTGYNFMGWKTTDGNGRTTYYQIVDNYTKNASATFYAVWTPIKYYIVYELNGGRFGSNNNGFVETKSYGQSYKIIDTIPTRGEKYDFNGWNTEPDGTGETYLSNSTYENNKNLILYAQWQPESYDVSYNFNGGNSGVISDQSKYYDIPLVLTSKIPSKTGYTFINWNTLQNGTGDVYLPNDIYNGNEGIILYAQWREKPKGWINRIKLLTGSEDNHVENEFTLGATFDQVQYSENNAMTLLDFINIIKKFFKSKMFMHYCGQEPTDNVMEWYQVVATNANPTKDELNAILG